MTTEGREGSRHKGGEMYAKRDMEMIGFSRQARLAEAASRMGARDF